MKTGRNLIAAVQKIELFDSCGLGVRVIGHEYRHDSLGTTGALKFGGRYNIPEGLPKGGRKAPSFSYGDEHCCG